MRAHNLKSRGLSNEWPEGEYEFELALQFPI